MSIEYKGETTRGVKRFMDLDLLVNKKEVSITVEIYSGIEIDNYVDYEIVDIKNEDNDDIELTDKELDEVDDFIKNNY